MFILKSRILVASCWTTGLEEYPYLILAGNSFDFSEDNTYSMLLSHLILGFFFTSGMLEKKFKTKVRAVSRQK